MDNDTHNLSDAPPAPADVLELTEFTVTADQAAELFKAAGFPRSPDHISRWCRQGELRATKQQTKNRLSRYLISRLSIDEKIARLRHDHEAHIHPSVFDSMNDMSARRRNSDAFNAATMSSRHNHDASNEAIPPSHPHVPYDWHERNEIAETRGELRAMREQARRDAAKIEKLEHENGGLRIALGQAKGRLEVKDEHLRRLEEQLRLPAPPQPSVQDHPTVSTATTPTNPPTLPWWRRLFR